MNRHVLSLVLLLSGALSLGAQDAKLQRSVSVTGTSTLEIEPDQAFLSITLKSVNANAARVADEQAAIVLKATTAILDVGLKRDDLSTSNMTFGENRVQKKDEWVVEGYVATSEMTFKLRDLSKHIPLWKALATVPGLSLSQIKFDHTKRMVHQDASRMKALEVATRKAEALARACQCRLGPPISIRESSPPELLPAGWNVFGNQFQQFGGAGGAGEVASNGTAGKIHVRATIDIVYELIPVK